MKIKELFNKLSKKKVYILLNKGNKGDGLILMGGRILLKSFNIDYKEIRYPEKKQGEILLVYGNGAFNKYSNHMVDYVNFYLNKFKKIYIFPASFDASYKKIKDFLNKLPKKVIIFCREEYSYKQIIENVKFKENIFLDKDLAFYVDYNKYKKKGKGKLIAFRQDSEKINGFRFNHKNKDISSFGNENNGESLIKEIANYKEVHTDRTHVAIASAMLGKKTYIYPINYHKNKGIYEYSLANLPNIKWVNKEPKFQFIIKNLNKILKRIESKRNSKYPLHKLLINTKDFFWKIIYRKRLNI